jgi:hypothetical protein
VFDRANFSTRERDPIVAWLGHPGANQGRRLRLFGGWICADEFRALAVGLQQQGHTSDTVWADPSNGSRYYITEGALTIRPS